MNRAPVFIGAAAVALLALSARSRETPEPVRPARQVLPRCAPPLPVEPPAAAGTATPPLPAKPTRTTVPTVPAGAEEDLRMLQEWILSLSAPELRALDGSGELNRRLAGIAAELAKRDAGELDRFLTRLNARLGVLPP